MATTERAAAKKGCETCHGPGSLHVADADHVPVINDFKVMAPAQINATCTTCHNRGEQALWDGSQHERRATDTTDRAHSIIAHGEVLQLVRHLDMTVFVDYNRTTRAPVGTSPSSPSVARCFPRT